MPPRELTADPTQLAFDLSKRWNTGQQSWSHRHDYCDTAALQVRVDRNDATARAFLGDHHYAGRNIPPTRLCISLWRGSSLVGSIVFGVPTHNASLEKYCAAVSHPRTDRHGQPGSPHDVACELSRLAILDSEGFNAETWFLTRAFALLRARKGITRVLSFADPFARRAADGTITKPQHWGTAYQAANALFAGSAEPSTVLVTKDGRFLNRRALQKIAAGETGSSYASRQLAASAGARLPDEPLRHWIARAVLSGRLRQQHHPGNLAYVFGLTRHDRSILSTFHANGLPYPKAPSEHRANPCATVDNAYRPRSPAAPRHY